MSLVLRKCRPLRPDRKDYGFGGGAANEEPASATCGLTNGSLRGGGVVLFGGRAEQTTFRALVGQILLKFLPLVLLQELEYYFCRSNRGAPLETQRIDLPQGTLDLLILRTLSLGRQHGWAISERVQQTSSDVLKIQQGSLYPALHRLERRGWIKASWGTSDNNRRAKYYELTRSGHKQLEVETDSWKKLTAAVSQILESV